MTRADRAPHHAFIGVSTLLVVVSTVTTVVWCASMTEMGVMPMAGGWTMSMAWMRMPERTWAAAVGSFLGMWTVMMVAMMLPALLPTLWRYRQDVAHTGDTRPDRQAAFVAAGYFFVWILFGAAAFPVGVATAAVEMRQPTLARAVPLASGAIVLVAGLLQFTSWKVRQLACCREPPASGRAPSAGAGCAWRDGLRLGRRCAPCCANLMTILLVIGAMDLRAMAAVTVLITAERLAPDARRVTRGIGALIVGAAVFLLARAAGSRFRMM